jgi:hypothetical protein
MAIVTAGEITITDQNDTPQISVTNDNITIATLEDGSGGVFDSTTSSTVSVLLGATNDTANWTITASPSASVSLAAFTAYKASVIGLTADSGTITFTATSFGRATLTKVVNVLKIKQGSSGATAYVALSVPADGEWFSYNQNASGSKGTSVNGPQSTYTRRKLEGVFGGSCIAVEESSRNLYADGDFEQSAALATFSGSATIVADQRAVSGKNVLRFTAGSNQYNLRNVTGTNGLKYSYSAWCYVTSDYNGPAPYISFENGLNGVASYDMNKKATWQLLKIENITLATGTTIQCTQYAYGLSTVGQVLFDNIMVEQKAFCTSFIPPSSTTLQSTHAVGSTVLAVGSTKSFYAGQTISIDTGGSLESKVISSIQDSTHLVVSATTKIHYPGAIITSLVGYRPHGQIVYTGLEANVNWDKWSFIGWIKKEATTVSNYNMIVGVWDKFYFALNPAGNIMAAWKDGTQKTATSTYTITDSNWHLIGISVDKAANTIRHSQT